MIRAGIIALTTMIMSAVVAFALVFSVSAQTATPTASPVPSTSVTPSSTMTPTPTGQVQGAQTVPSGAPATGMGGY